MFCLLMPIRAIHIPIVPLIYQLELPLCYSFDMEGPVQQTTESLLSQGVEAHALGDFEEAIRLREAASQQMGIQDPRYPGLLGTIGLAYDRIGNHNQALQAAQVGYTTLYLRLKSEAITEAQREQLLNDRPTVELHLGLIVARATAKVAYAGEPFDRKQFTTARRLIDAAQAHQREQRASARKLHQWDINMLRRRAGAIAMDPDAPKGRGILLGFQAIAKGALSESPAFVAGTSIFEHHAARARIRAKAKAVLGGAAATTQCILSLSSSKPAQRIKTKIAASKAVF